MSVLARAKRKAFGQLGMETTEEEIRTAAEQFRGTVEERRRKTQWTKGVIRALIVVCVFFIFQQITGINVSFYYGLKILATFFQSGHNAVAAAVAGVEVTAILGAVNVIATYFAFRWIDKFGRRPLAMGGYAGMAVFMLVAAAGVAFFTDIPKTVVVMVGFSFFITSFAIGVGGTGWLIQGEVFPTSVRGRDRRGRGLGGQFRADRGVPGLAECMGLAGVMVSFAVLSVVAIGFVFKFLPETKGPSARPSAAGSTGSCPHSDTTHCTAWSIVSWTCSAVGVVAWVNVVAISWPLLRPRDLPPLHQSANRADAGPPEGRGGFGGLAAAGPGLRACSRLSNRGMKRLRPITVKIRKTRLSAGMISCSPPPSASAHLCAATSALNPAESQYRVRVMSTTTLAFPRLPASSRTVRSCSALAMSISAGAETTATPLIIRGCLLSNTCAHLPRTRILPDSGWVMRTCEQATRHPGPAGSTTVRRLYCS